jgi:hypothetical protein
MSLPSYASDWLVAVVKRLTTETPDGDCRPDAADLAAGQEQGGLGLDNRVRWWGMLAGEA